MKETWQIETIINVSKQLHKTGRTGASTGEVIAAAFVLNNPAFLPHGYTDLVEAWDRLDDEWQDYVRQVKYDYMYLILGE